MNVAGPENSRKGEPDFHSQIERFPGIALDIGRVASPEPHTYFTLLRFLASTR